MLATAEKGAGPCSTAQQGEHDSHVHQSPAPASLFIIHESSSSSILPNGGSASPPKLRRRRNKSRSPGASRAHHISSGPRQKKSTLRSSAYTSDPTSCKTSSHASATVRAVSPSVIPVLNEGQEGKEEEQQQNEPETTSAQVTAKNNRAMELSILNRCGTAPDLPMYSPLSASVYSSSKKRSMQSNNNGSSPHLATIQRSRLTPLPNNVCAPVVKPDPFLDNLDEMDTRQGSTLAVSEDLSIVSLKAKDPLLQEKMRHDAQTIASLKQRLMALEREVSASTKYRHMTEKQIAQLSLENQRLQTEKIQQQSRIDELDKTVLRQRHEYDKLAARYASVYANLQKLVDQQQNASDKSAQQSALQALARENQDFLRKLRVLEARHVEDKTLTFNQEKKIKRLKAEIEALQHMHDAKNRDGDYEESASDTDQVSSLNKSKKRTDGEANHVGRPGSASSSVSITSSTPRRAGSSARVQVAQASPVGTASHLVTAEAYQYIDPNILKVLEKVDSQFSITNAINLSVVLKKWLNSCVHTVCSTHLPTVLQTLLKRMCELLHCEHAALFTVDHATRKLVAVCSERGSERWELPLDKGIAGYAARHNVLCNVHCANDDPRFYSSTDSITGTTSREVLALPIVHELQLFLEAHLAASGDHTRNKMNSLGVFAVLRSWNTTHQKPFSANDQILGCLLAIQAGIILRQTAVTKTLQKINHKTHQILQMPSDIVAKASAAHNVKHMTSEVTGNPSVRSPTQSAVLSEFAAATVIPSVVQLVAVAQKELGECLGIKQLRIFVLDAGAQKFWHVGEQLPHDSGDSVIPTVVRRYVSAQASLCSLLLRTDATSMVLAEPSAEAVFNDTVDIPGGARGLYLAPILSPWGNEALPLGVVQVARVAKARLSASPFALTTSEGAGNGIVAGSVADIVVSNEREAAQQTEDRLMLELLGLFCRVFAGLLHHVAAQQIYDSCPPEILQAQLAFLTTHLDTLAAKRMEDDECEDEAELANMSAALSPEEAIQVDRSLNSRQSGRHSSVTSIRTSKQSYNIRRVVSADPKHRASPTSRRATSSPSHNPYISGRDKTSHQHELKALHNWEASQRGDFDVGANDGDATATITNTVVADATGAASRDREICKQESKHDLLVSDQAHEIVDVSEQAMLGDATSNHVSSSGNLAPTSDASAVTPDAEQPSSEGDTGWNWGAGDANDSASWSGGENVGGFEEGTAWEYGAVEDATLPNDEDDDSRKMWGGSHISTNSTYAIDLHLSSRNTSSAETDEPSGAL